MKHICRLDERAARARGVAGGKGAGLAGLRAAGFDVPDGFVITTRVFREAARSGDVLPQALAAGIVRAARRLGGPLAVRSSLVAEDGAGLSFAGQLESRLNVDGDEALLAAVRGVYQSVQHASFARYASRAGADAGAGLDLAVVVQRMIDPRAAGAAFSVDPVTGERHVVIEAVAGLADQLMGGTAVPSRFVVDTRGRLIVADRRGVDAGALPDEAVLRVAAVVRDVADRAGGPQDVEWAWTGGRVTLLQARPITVLASQHVYSRRLVGDMSPGLIKPLLWSTHSRSMTRRVFQRLFTELIGPVDLDYARLIRRVYSRMYADMTLFGQLLARTGLPANFFESMTRDDHAARPRVSRARLLAGIPRMAGFLWRHARAGRPIEAFLARHDGELRPFRDADWSTAALDDLLRASVRLQDAHGESQWHMFVGAMNMAVRSKLLRRVAERRAPGAAAADLTRGLSGLKAFEPNIALRRIAAGAAPLDDDARRLLKHGQDRDIRHALAASSAGQALARAMDAYLARFGYLATNGPDFTEPRWSEDPTIAWRALSRMLEATDPAPAGLNDAESSAARERARDAVRSRLGPIARAWFDRLLSSTTAYVDRRERLSAAMTADAHQARRLFLAVGDRLVDRGDIRGRDDVFMLYFDELQALVERRLEAVVARARIADRQAELSADAAVEPPETFCGEHPPIIAPSHDPGELLIGIPGSAGVIQGYACVVLDPAAAPASLSREHVLVVPFTDVGWMPLFASIGGVVAECGGQLSHTAIVAREYRLPTVLGIPHATRVIRDGQAITVDGTRGVVYLKHLRPQAPEDEA